MVAKDQRFYSAEERSLALNELEARNELSEELLQIKKSVEQDVIVITEQALEVPTVLQQ